MGPFLSCDRRLSFPLKWRHNLGETLELHKWCKALVSSFKRELGIVLEVLQGKRASSLIEGSSFLELRREAWGSSRVSTGTSGIFVFLFHLGHHRALQCLFSNVVFNV